MPQLRGATLVHSPVSQILSLAIVDMYLQSNACCLGREEGEGEREYKEVASGGYISNVPSTTVCKGKYSWISCSFTEYCFSRMRRS